jgi:hypothetical protein
MPLLPKEEDAAWNSVPRSVLFFYVLMISKNKKIFLTL